MVGVPGNSGPNYAPPAELAQLTDDQLVGKLLREATALAEKGDPGRAQVDPADIGYLLLEGAEMYADVVGEPEAERSGQVPAPEELKPLDDVVAALIFRAAKQRGFIPKTGLVSYG